MWVILIVAKLFMLTPEHPLAQAPAKPIDEASALVLQLGEFPATFPPPVRADGSLDPAETRRATVYVRLLSLGVAALPALARGLEDDDVQIRRNAALFLGMASGGWSDYSRPKLNIVSILPTLITAIVDRDPRVRQLSAQAIGTIGAPAASAVPSLIQLLTNVDEGTRNSACLALRGIGPPARAALPALRLALSDPSQNVQRFARLAIEVIESR